MHICVSAKETWWTANPSYLPLNLTLSDLLVGVMELIPLATRSVPFFFHWVRLWCEYISVHFSLLFSLLTILILWCSVFSFAGISAELYAVLCQLLNTRVCEIMKAANAVMTVTTEKMTWKNSGFELDSNPRPFTLPVQCSTNWAIKATWERPCVGSALDSYSTGIRLVRAAGIFSAVLFMFWLVFPAVVDVRLSTMLINITLLLSLYVICTSHLLMHCRQRLDWPIFDMH